MTALAEKLKWEPGTRVIYTSPLGPIELKITSAGHNRWDDSDGIVYDWVHCRAGAIFGWFRAADLELAPRFEVVGVRWEVRYVDEWKRDIVVYRYSLKSEATRERDRYQQRDTKNRTFRRVKVTVTKKVQP